MPAYVAAYASAPSTDPWDKAVESDFYHRLAALDIAGLELPYFGRLHRQDEAWLIDQLQPGWTFVLTLMPGEMDRIQENQKFGLASTNRAGRKSALDFTASARLAIEQLHSSLGRPAVKAVEIHSAPQRSSAGKESSPACLTESLNELRRWDWHGAELILEHCDAFVPGQAPVKGFLRLEDEIAAVEHSNGRTRITLGVNWGRSALETRSASGALDHIRRLRQSNLLGALFFSGVTAADKDYGSWQDAHPPFSTCCPNSLLTPTAAQHALKEAGPGPVIGVKFQILPRASGVEHRLAAIEDGLRHLSL